MQTYIPFSEKQQIFTPAEWEEMHLLDTTCETSKVAAKIIRKVVQRLLSIDKTGKDFNINDFEYVVSDDEQANAAFVSKSKTQNGKYVIFITKGILDLCANEDEFAGVLAHELGHFTYDKIYGDNNNTVFQERFSDLHALDLMLAGGYDPAAYSKVCEKMYKFSIGMIAGLDVHGSSFARKEDVDTYLTKLHKEQGNFVVSPQTGLWDNFTATLTKNKDRDVFDSYWQGSLNNHFQNIDNKQPPIQDILNFVLSEMANDKLNNLDRIRDVSWYLMNLKSDNPEIDATQDFMEKFCQLYMQIQDVESKRAWELSDLFIKIKQNLRKDKAFKIVEPFTTQLNNIHEFMTTRDKERAQELASDYDMAIRHHNNSSIIRQRKELFDVYDIKTLRNLFNEPNGFSMPSIEQAVGQTMPTDWLLQQNSDKILLLVIAIGLESRYEYITDSELHNITDGELNKKSKFPTYNVRLHYVLDGELDQLRKVCYNIGTGKIISTDHDEIEKLCKDKKGKMAQEKYKNVHEQFLQMMSAINALYKFDKGDLSEAKKFVYQYGLDRLWNLVTTPLWIQNPNNENPYFQTDMQELQNNEAFTELYIKPFLQILKQSMHKCMPDLDDVVDYDTPQHNMTYLEHLIYILEIAGIQKDSKTGIRLDDAIGFASWNAGCIKKLYDVYEKVFQNIMNESAEQFRRADINMFMRCFDKLTLSEQSNNNKFLATEQTKNLSTELNRLQNEQIKNIKDKMLEPVSIYAGPTDIWDKSCLQDAITKELKNHTDLHILKRKLQAFDLLANNEQDLIDILSNDSTFHTKEKIQAILYYMYQDYPITNMVNFLSQIKHFAGDFQDYMKDEICDYINKHNLIPDDFQSQYNLYCLMEESNIFSKERSNQEKMLNMMLPQLEQMPEALRQEYAYKLLSGFYNSENKTPKLAKRMHSNNNRKADELKFPVIKKKLMDIYTDLLFKRFGYDDGTDEYFNKIQNFVNFISEQHEFAFGRTRSAFNKKDLNQLYRLLSDKIQSQERVSQLFVDNKNISISNKNIELGDILGRVFENLLDILSEHPDMATYSIEFLNTKLTEKSISDYCQKCVNYIREDDNTQEYIKPEYLENFYNTFWTSGLEIRSVIMNKLLNRACKTLDEKIAYVCNMNFSKDNKYRKDAELIFDCVIKSFEEYEQGLMLAAVASADKNKTECENSSRSVGDGLRMFCENMGPAWVKFGQLLSYVPELPSEIRHDLGKLKDKANIPARWELYNQLQEALPEELRNRIERVEDIPGAGSFWVTAVIQFRTDKGKTEKKVIQLLRPKAAECAEAGFETIEKAIQALTKHNSSYSVLKNVAHQARESAKYEVDAEFGNKQYIKAKELYGDIKVQVEGTTYTPHVADWDYYGTGKDGVGYKIMDYAKGATLSRVQASEDERRKMALAYFTIELTNLFKGDVWDIDRHQGQQNFDVLSDKEVQINIYDTGAQLPKAPNKTNKIILANVFFGLIASVESGKSIDSYILKVIHHLDKLQKTLNVDVSYVSNVQKGLMALSDILEYQKEIKDADGHIIQERKKLSRDDLTNAVKSVLANPSVDTYLKVIIEARFLTHKLSKKELAVLKSFGRENALNEHNPVVIEIAQQALKIDSKHQNKTQGEIDALYKPEDYTLGIPNKYIAKDIDEILADQLKQLGLSLG